MANERWPVLSGTSEILPTANGTFQTADMSTSQGNNGFVYFEFYSDAAGTIPVTPTAGTITIQGSPMGNNWITSPSGGTVSASTCSTPNSTYTPPSFLGRIVRGQIIFNGISGAAYARAIFWRY